MTPDEQFALCRDVPRVDVAAHVGLRKRRRASGSRQRLEPLREIGALRERHSFSPRRNVVTGMNAFVTPLNVT